MKTKGLPIDYQLLQPTLLIPIVHHILCRPLLQPIPKFPERKQPNNNSHPSDLHILPISPNNTKKEHNHPHLHCSRSLSSPNS